MGQKIKKFLISLILPILFLTLWELYAIQVGNEAVLPSIWTVFSHLINPMQNFIGIGSLPRNLGFSLTRLLIGYFVGAIIAIPLGLIMGYFPLMRNLIENFINLFKPIPPIAWQPLVLGWFGISSIATLINIEFGETFVTLDNIKLSMIFIIALGTFFPVFANTMFGVLNTPKTWIESAQVLGAKPGDVFQKILLPAAGPSIMNGLRMGMATAWVCLVSAEMLPGSMAGIGYLITHAYELTRIDLIIVGMIVIGATGWLIDYLFKIISEKYFAWGNQK